MPSELVYSTSTGSRGSSGESSRPGEIALDGGIILRLEPDEKRVHLGKISLDVAYANEGDPRDDYIAQFRIDCGYSYKTKSHHLVYDVTIYRDGAMVERQHDTWDGDRPSGCHADLKEFDRMLPFLYYLKKTILPDYQRSRRLRDECPND